MKTTAQVKRDFRRRGVTVTAWAEKHGIHHQTVRDILDGKLKGHRGDAHKAAVLLGLKDGVLDEAVNDKKARLKA